MKAEIIVEFPSPLTDKEKRMIYGYKGELIRCKDCKWYEARIKRCNNSKSTEWKPDDYCSDAARKEHDI